MLFYRGALTYAEDRNHDDRHGLTPVELEVLKHVGELPTDVGDSEVSPVVNHGRWIIPCPWCFSASMASRDDPRFLCVECRNGGTERWARVVWPDAKDTIEELLTMRPDPRTRNWAPPESAADLLAENEAHGVL